MEILNYIFFGIVAVYAVIILRLAFGFKKVLQYKLKEISPKIKFSILVPFRDEAENLPGLLHSFSQLNYPRDLFEIIFVNDDSRDNSVEIIENFPALSYSFQTLNNKRKSNSPKKDAITTAMQFAKNDWIITTDADCFVHLDWLSTFDSFIQKTNCEMIAGAVSYDAEGSFLHQFQQMDLMSLQGATIGSFGIGKPFMCNGANFGYTKNLFAKLNGFEGNDTIASGDDVFLLQKAIRQFPEKVQYLKAFSAIVFTKPLNDWKALFYQRVRWASKSSSYECSFGKMLALIVFAGNLAIIVSFFLTLFSFFSFWNWYLLFALKIFVDFLLLYQTGKFIQPRMIRYFIFSNLLYPFFSTAVAFYSFFGKYEWKGRKF
ncbi:glycosyltransferase [Flavobacterium sp. NST-5]|uniref:Glycosyltransferase n=1 Tax=Flavobacterium ichthyis TaxID=2698827 RepID=A0ABW9Z6Z1_9FLAO|nr:glycosyltransferase [Flavobacterium ichthyis]NBL64641.1 glycosyltransferase [Flavobacterium ichthyis]